MNKVLNENNVWLGVKANSKADGDFTIPVFDARRSENERAIVSHIKKSINFQKGSRYMKPSYSVYGGCYQISRKK